jgi:hypothetical protein
MTKSDYFNPTFIALFLIIIWDALKNYLSLSEPIIQLAVFLPVISIGILYNLNMQFRRTMFSRPAAIWLIWIIYGLINTFLIIGYHSTTEQNPLVFISSIIIAYLFFLLVIVCKSSTKELINVLIFSYSFRLMLSFIFDTFESSGREYVARLGSDFNANIIAIGALFLASIILLKKISFGSLNKIDYPISVAALLTIFLTASRKTFIALIVLIIGFIYVTRSRYLIKNVLWGSLAFIILFFGIMWSLENTAVGERLVSAYEKTTAAKEQEQMFDNRMGFFIDGWTIFKENPINGIGLRNFPYVNGTTHVLHTEYMVQLTECGLIGAFLFLLFYGHILKKLLLIRSKIEPYKKIAEAYLVLLFVMFFLFLGAWKYNIPIMWVLIALAVRFIKETEREMQIIEVS